MTARGCVFCRIVEGREPAVILGTWKDTIAVVPLRPVTPGHALIIPKTHVDSALENPRVTALTFARAAVYARRHGITSCNLITSAGLEATQSVFHLHIHVVPRRRGDGLALPWTARELVG